MLQAAIRLADQPNATTFDDKFEIVLLVGTLGRDGVNLHLVISDGAGKTIGGHLVEGCLIYTPEIVIGEANRTCVHPRTRQPDGIQGVEDSPGAGSPPNSPYGLFH